MLPLLLAIAVTGFCIVHTKFYRNLEAPDSLSILGEPGPQWCCTPLLMVKEDAWVRSSGCAEVIFQLRSSFLLEFNFIKTLFVRKFIFNWNN